MNEKVSVVGEPKLAPIVKEEEVDLDSIVDDIELDIEEEEHEEGDAPKSETPAAPIDIASLSMAQIQELQARLNAAPSRADEQIKHSTVKLRVYDGKVVTDFANAYLGLVDDPENNRQVQRHIIPVTLQGIEKPVHMKYRDFMNLEQIDCEVIKKEERDASVVRGNTYNEHDELVEMKIIKKTYFFTLKLPPEYGDKISIEGKIVNG